MNIQWWGYLHVNGTIKVKRYFGDWDGIQKDMQRTDLVAYVIGPFEACERDAAIKIIKETLDANYKPAQKTEGKTKTSCM